MIADRPYAEPTAPLVPCVLPVLEGELLPLDEPVEIHYTRPVQYPAPAPAPRRNRRLLRLYASLDPRLFLWAVVLTGAGLIVWGVVWSVLTIAAFISLHGPELLALATVAGLALALTAGRKVVRDCCTCHRER